MRPYPSRTSPPLPPLPSYLPAPPPVLTDAWCDGRSALLVTLVAPVTRQAGHAVLTGTLSRGLVTRLALRADRVARARCGEGGGERGGQVRLVVKSEPQSVNHSLLLTT